MTRGAARLRGLLAGLLIAALPATGLTMPLAARAAARAPAAHPGGHAHVPGPHPGRGPHSAPGPHAGSGNCCDWCVGACTSCAGGAPETETAPPSAPPVLVPPADPVARIAGFSPPHRLPFPLGPPALRS